MVAAVPDVKVVIIFLIPVAAISGATPAPIDVAANAATSDSAIPAILPNEPIRLTTSPICTPVAAELSDKIFT